MLTDRNFFSLQPLVVNPGSFLFGYFKNDKTSEYQPAAQVIGMVIP